MADTVLAVFRSAKAKGVNYRQCEGFSISGQRCKRGCSVGKVYCATHDRNADIGLPPFVTCNGGHTKLMIYNCLSPQRWRVGNRAPAVFRCLATGEEYGVLKFIAEGSYGAVYDSSLSATGLSSVSQRLALKACKTTFNSRRLRGAESMEMMEDEYLRELFVTQTAHQRLAATPQGDDVVVPYLDPFVVKAGTGGLYGCFAMERLEGDLADVFDDLETKSKHCNEALRFWAICCFETARMLHRLHEVGVYHLDAKPGNLMIKRTPGVGRGFQLRLIDFGLGAYLPRGTPNAAEPQMECRATGTFLPPEWRHNGDRHRPSFELLSRHEQIEIGETYALCKTCLDLWQSLHSSVRSGAFAKKLRSYNALVYALEAGQKDSLSCTDRMRACGGVCGVRALAEAALKELDNVLTGSSEPEMLKLGLSIFSKEPTK